MAKIADEYIEVDPWKIVEKGWHKERNQVSESLFSLANEYMGVRGYAEEGVIGASLLGSYFNGVYEEEPTEGTAYKGIVQKTHFMVNAANWLYVRIILDGETVTLCEDDNKIQNFTRELDMRNGTYIRSYTFISSTGKTLNLKFVRLLDMENAHRAYQKIVFEPVNFSGKVEVQIGTDFSILHNSRQKCYWQKLKSEVIENYCMIMAQTIKTEQKVFSGFYLNGKIENAKDISHDNFAGFQLSVSLEEGKTSELERNVCNVADKKSDFSSEELWKNGKEELISFSKETFEKNVQNQQAYWNQIWRNNDIQIHGDSKNQQGIRFCIFQMQQTYHGLEESNNIGAKGLSGEAYNGHAFWDTETYCLSYYLYTDLKAAKNLLEYRFHTLEQAKERAKMLDCTGACYPVATLNGVEACNLWQHASLQFQPSTGVVYGIAHYAALSKDTKFLYGHGAQMVVEICRFLSSRGAWNQDKTGFGFYAVMGPDEFHMMVNNNVYTNFMAKKSFEFCVELLQRMKSQSKSEYDALCKSVNLVEDEVEYFKLLAEKMIILYSDETKLYEQHEGYFTVPHIDVDKIPISDFPLYSNWSYDRIYRTDMIKQPDVLMFMYLYPQDFTDETVLANYEYYEPRTIHESSLSPSVHSVLATRLNKIEEACNFFGFATRLDLDNYNRNTREGLHTTSIAAAWVNIVFGFGGLSSSPNMTDQLCIAPVLPEQWKGFEFHITYHGVPVTVSVNRENVELKFLNDEENSINVRVYNKPYVLTQKGLCIPFEG